MPVGALTDLLKYGLERRAINRERVADYLDELSQSADRLAEVWRQTVSVCIELIRTGQEPEIAQNSFLIVGNQRLLFHELQAFYKNLERVLPNETDAAYRSSLDSAFLRLIRFRETAKEHLSLLLDEQDPQNFVDQACIEVADIQELQTAALELQKEAAEIRVLAKAFRAIG
jgi:hypothetical protein